MYPDHHAPGGLDTPPMTDADYSSQLDTESDHGSLDVDSDIEPYPTHANRSLSTISEDIISTLPVLANDPLSVSGDADVESEPDASLIAGLNRLSLSYNTLSDFTPNPASQTRHVDAHLFLRRQARHHRQERSTSSPSRSPVRHSWFKDRQPLPQRSKDFPLHDHHQSFYDYLFS